MSEQFFISLVCFAAGMGWRRLQLSTGRVVALLSALISWVLLPVVIVVAMGRLRISGDLLLLPAANLFIVVVLAGVAMAGARLLGLRRQTAGAVVIAFASLEGGSIGLALVLSLFGTPLLAEFLVFDVVHALILFTLIYLIACVYGDSHHGSSRFLRTFLFGPIPLSVSAGLLLNATGVEIGEQLGSILNFAGYLILPIVFAILGLRFTFDRRYLLPALMLGCAKTVIGYVLGYGFVLLLEPSAAASAVILLGASLPPSFLTLIFAEEQKLDTAFLATFLPLSAVLGSASLYLAFRFFPVLAG